MFGAILFQLFVFSRARIIKSESLVRSQVSSASYFLRDSYFDAISQGILITHPGEALILRASVTVRVVSWIFSPKLLISFNFSGLIYHRTVAAPSAIGAAPSSRSVFLNPLNAHPFISRYGNYSNKPLSRHCCLSARCVEMRQAHAWGSFSRLSFAILISSMARSPYQQQTLEYFIAICTYPPACFYWCVIDAKGVAHYIGMKNYAPSWYPDHVFASDAEI